jgi:GNAT superfamily N-acetyltransferase
MSARSVAIRRARPGDGPAFVGMHAELGETYATLSPELFQRPVTAGLADEFEALVAMDDERALHLIAEVDGEPAAGLGARILAPDDDASHQIQRDAGSTRLRIEYVVTAAAHRRRGLATRLVEAAEAWGRDCGATVAETWTYHRSPMSLPFWEQRAGYGERSVNLRKPLV